MSLTFTPTAVLADIEDDEEQETSARFDVTSDVLTEPGEYVLGIGTRFVSQRIDGGQIDNGSLRALGLYSISERLDLFGSVSGERTREQVTTTDQMTGESTTATDYDSGFGELTLGVRYQVIPEKRRAGLRVQGNLTMGEDAAGSHTLTGQLINVQLHRTVDPMNLRLQMRYQRFEERRAQRAGEQVDLDPGDEYSLVGEMDFVVNDQVVLTGGAGLTYGHRNRIDGERDEGVRFRTPLKFGLRYGMTPVTNVETRVQTEPQVDATAVEMTLTRSF